MSYYYRPTSTGIGKLNRSNAHRAIPAKPPREPRHIPWNIIGLVMLVLVVGGLGYLGFTKTQGYLKTKRLAAETKKTADAEAAQKALTEELKNQIKTAEQGITVWQQKIDAKDPIGAVAAAQVTLDIQPNWREGYLMLGTAQLYAKDFTATATALQHALAIDPTYAPTHKLMAAFYQETKQADLAQAETEKAISLSKTTGVDIGG